MADKGLSFKPYWRIEKDKFEKEGILPCLDYPMLNDMINGVLVKSFDETLKTEAVKDMNYNPQKNKFLKNFKLYLNEIKRDLSKVYSVIEVNLYRIQRKSSMYLDAVNKPEGKTLGPHISSLFHHLQLVSKFAKFNYEIYCHLIKKTAKQYNRLEINFELEAFNSMMADHVSCVCLTNLRLQEVIEHVQVLIAYTANQQPIIQSAISEMSQQLTKIDQEIDQIRKDLVRSAPAQRRETINGLFENKKTQILKELRKEIGNLHGVPESFLQRSHISLPRGENQDNILMTDTPDMEGQPKLDALISGLKPSGDDSPLDIDEETQFKLQPDHNENEFDDAHTIRNIEKFFVDINEGYVVTAQACYDTTAPWIVLAHTFFYMLLYYGLTPTTFDCNVLLLIPRQYFGVVSAMTPVVAASSCFFYNYMTKMHYKTSFLISTACQTVGAFLYCLSFTHRNLAVLFIGRCLLGFGGGRILTRKFFTREIHIDHRVKWSAMLVGFTGMSMTFGPGLSALLETIFDPEQAKGIKLDKFSKLSRAEQDIIIGKLTSFSIGGMRFAKVNYLPGVLMLIFFVMFFVILFFYKDTPEQTPQELESERKNLTSNLDQKYIISDIKNIQMLPADPRSTKVPDADQKKRLSKYLDKLKTATKYFTDVQTYYAGAYLFVIKAIQECIIVESPSYITKNYGYTSVISGLIFFLFTFFTLPAALAPTFLKKRFEDRAVLRVASYLLIAAMFIKIQFTKDIYPFGVFILATCLVLGFTLTAETSSSAILTKVISEKKAKTFMNAGILAGLIDTLGRASGSTSITIISTFIELKSLNTVLYPIWQLIFCVIVVCLVCMYTRLDTKMYVRFG